MYCRWGRGWSSGFDEWTGVSKNVLCIVVEEARPLRRLSNVGGPKLWTRGAEVLMMSIGCRRRIVLSFYLRSCCTVKG